MTRPSAATSSRFRRTVRQLLTVFLESPAASFLALKVSSSREPIPSRCTAPSIGIRWCFRIERLLSTVDGLLSVAGYFRVPKARAGEILRAVVDAVGQWRVVGKGLGMTARDLDAFAGAFEHAERDAARRRAS